MLSIICIILVLQMANQAQNLIITSSISLSSSFESIDAHISLLWLLQLSQVSAMQVHSDKLSLALQALE